MKKCKVYIASSWRNAHGVELLTDQLRALGCDVISWVENNYGEGHNVHDVQKFDFESWMLTPGSDQAFTFDAYGAIGCDLFIYYAPAGNDAAAELGAAYGSKMRGDRDMQIWGLWAKGEQLGLMRKMVSRWFTRPAGLIKSAESFLEHFHADKK